MDYNNKWVRDAARQWINDLVQDGTIPASYATKTHTPDYQPPVSPSQAPHQPYSEQIAEKIARNARHIFLETIRFIELVKLSEHYMQLNRKWTP